MGDGLLAGRRFSGACPPDRKLVMIRFMKSMSKLNRRIAAALVLLSQPAALLAQASTDARLEGYPKLGDSSALMTWIIFAALAAACVGVMFYKSPGSKEKE